MKSKGFAVLNRCEFQILLDGLFRVSKSIVELTQTVESSCFVIPCVLYLADWLAASSKALIVSSYLSRSPSAILLFSQSLAACSAILHNEN